VRIGLAEELGNPAEHRVADKKHAAHGAGRPGLARKYPDDRKKREAFQGSLVELRRMACQVIQCARLPGLLQGHARKILTGE